MEQQSQTVAAVASVLGLLTLIVGFVVLIIRGSRHTQKTESTVEHILEALTRHADDKSIHTNDKLEELKYNTLKNNLDEVKTGVNELRKEMGRRMEDLNKT